MEEIAEIYSNKNSNITFYKIDVVESGWISLRFNLEKIPNLIYASKGKFSIFPLIRGVKGDSVQPGSESGR